MSTKKAWTSTGDKVNGKKLWETKTLRKHNATSETIFAKCADCHFRSGRDLKAFGFSPFSIEQRAKFHGLSDREARDVSAFILSIDEEPRGCLGIH